MNRLPVRFRERASEDLFEILDYVLEQSRDPGTASQYVSRIRARCTAIGDAPYSWVARDDLRPGIRMIPFELGNESCHQVWPCTRQAKPKPTPPCSSATCPSTATNPNPTSD